MVSPNYYSIDIENKLKGEACYKQLHCRKLMGWTTDNCDAFKAEIHDLSARKNLSQHHSGNFDKNHIPMYWKGD